MEHDEVRKKLKDYAKGNIYDHLQKEAMEAHIEKCQLCMRELALWQDVLDKQKLLSNMRYSSGLAERIRKVNKDIDRDVTMSAAAKRFGYMTRAMRSPGGFTIIVISAVLLGLGLLLMIVKEKVSPIVHVLMIIGGLSLIFVSFKTMWAKRKKK
jgi:hypothetical protein